MPFGHTHPRPIEAAVGLGVFFQAGIGQLALVDTGLCNIAMSGQVFAYPVLIC